MSSRTLTLRKAGQTYAFEYNPGHERETIDQIARIAAEHGGDALDWLDAATLSFQLARNAANDCSAVLSPAGEGQEPTCS